MLSCHSVEMRVSNNILRGSARAGFALVVVLIILTLLAVVAVGFLSSMTAERTTASAYASKAIAEQSTQAGVDSAIATLRQYFSVFPDSCTSWDVHQSVTDVKGPNNAKTYGEGTTFYYRGATAAPTKPDAKTPDANRPRILQVDKTPDPRQIYALPLTSGVIGGLAQLEKNKETALPVLNVSKTDLSEQNFADLNLPRFKGDTEGWIGSPPAHPDKDSHGNPAPKPIRAPWVELKDDRGAVNGRYAYWVEDESFRTNVNTSNIGDPSAANIRRDNHENPSAADPLGYVSPRDVDLLGPLTSLGDPAGAADALSMLNTRLAYPQGLFPEARAYAHTPALSASIADQLRFLTTSTSIGLNISRHGSQRLNLNAIIPPTTPATEPTTDAKIQQQLDEIVQTLRFHVPDFGQRFYRLPDPSASELNRFEVLGDGLSKDSKDYSLIYLYKVAANIRDAIDTDLLPTYVQEGGIVRRTGKMDVWPQAQFWAIGKDSAPYVSETGVRFTGAVTGAHYVLNVDYYIEVWNMTSRAIRASELGANPIIRVANPPVWVASNSKKEQTIPPKAALEEEGPLTPTSTVSPYYERYSGTPPLPRDFDIAIDQSFDTSGGTPQEVVFPAGAFTVITTDAKFNHTNAEAFSNQDIHLGVGNLQLAKDVQPPITDAEALRHVLLCKWKPGGTSTYVGSIDPHTPVLDVIKMKPFSGAITDAQTDVVIQSDKGIIDGSSGAMPIESISPSQTAMYINYGGGGNQPPIFGGYLRGNWTNLSDAANQGLAPSAVGDPRANNEQLEPDTPTSVASETTRFKNWDVAQRPTPATHPYDTHPYTKYGVIPTLGLPNYLSVRPNRYKNPWIDYPPLFSADPNGAIGVEDLKMGPDKAVTTLPNGPLSSIGQLGEVYDPARIASESVVTSRGGGRTFKIGQHDDRWDGNESSASREWTSWRLLDFFSIADAPEQPRLLTKYGIEQPGLININGVARDNGTALKAALTGLKYQPKPFGDPALGEHGDSPTVVPAVAPQVQKLVDQMIARIGMPLTNGSAAATGTNQTGAGPFWERGEMSELPIFGRSPSPPTPEFSTTELTGIDMSSKVYDRGREELFRRLAEMITTRGDVFTVYAVGQAITQKSAASPKIYSGVQKLKVTFQLVPKKIDSTTHVAGYFHPGTDDAGKSRTFDYTKDDALKVRFAAPDYYDVQIIASNAGN